MRTRTQWMTPGTTYTADYSDYNPGPPQVSGQHFGHHLPVDYTVINPTGMAVVPTFKYTLDLFYTLSF